MKNLLRPYQQSLVNEARNALASVDKLLVVSPTGSGKTVVFVSITGLARERGTRVLILLPRRELVYQTSAKLEAAGIFHGVIMAGEPMNLAAPVQVASIATLHRRALVGLKFPMPSAELVIVDEAHLSVAGMPMAILEKYPDAKVLGFTATPARSDGKGLGQLYQGMISGASIGELTAAGYLAPVRYFAPAKADLSGLKTSKGDYTEKSLSTLEDAPVLVGDVVTNWLRIAPNRKTVVFGINRAHARHLCDAFLAAGIKAEYLDGETPNDERAGILRRIESGETQVLCNVFVLTYGWDCLDTDTEILTPNGWVGIGKISKGETCYGYDTASKKIKPVPVLDYGERVVRDGEKMFSHTSQHTNIRTTEGHKFHVRYRDPKTKTESSSVLIKTGAELAMRKSPYYLPLSGSCDFSGVPLSDNELRLVAWYVTDGSLQKSKLSIWQSKPNGVEKIRNLLDELGLDYTVRAKPHSSGGSFKPNHLLYEFCIPKGNHSGSMKRNGWLKYSDYLDKNISPKLLQLTERQFDVFWEALLDGDGERQKGKAGWLWTNRTTAKDRLMQMSVLRNRATSCSSRKGITSTNWRIGSRKKQSIQVQPSSHRPPKIELTDPKLGEKVWCVTNELETLVTRRKGKVSIIGNCPPMDCAVLARPTKSVVLYLQMVGRIMRATETKRDALVIDHTGTVDEIGFVDDEFAWSLSDKDSVSRKRQEAVKAEPKKITCIKCSTVFTRRKDCPHCGHELSDARQIVEVMDGDLVELDKAKKRKNREWTREQKLHFYSELATYGYNKGYKSGWADRKYQERFGVWPNAIKSEAYEAQPSPETKAWIVSRNIAWAKRNAA